MSSTREFSRGLLANRFVRFLLAGGLAAICNFGSRFLYSLLVDFSVAVVLAFATGLTVGYLLNKRYVFTESRNTPAQEILWFLSINLFALLQTWGLSVYLAGVLPEYGVFGGEEAKGWVEGLAHGAGVLLPVFTSYIGHKYLTFRE
ncbi:MAG: GtrA family protein [Halioglobus sp.]